MIICQRSPVLSVPPHNDTIHYKHDRAGLRQAQIGTLYTDLTFLYQSQNQQIYNPNYQRNIERNIQIER